MSETPVPLADSCAAGVTVYRPDEAILLRLIERLRAAGTPTFVHVDGPIGEAIGHGGLAALRGDPNLTILQAERNGGIGRALNRLAAAASERGFRRVLLLDQDSDAPRAMADALSASLDRAEGGGRKVAALGPRPVAPPGEATKPPRYRIRSSPSGSAALAGVDFIITSGSLIPLDAWHAVGPFREDYFIDAIDVEWCFRAWDRGYEVLLDPAIALPHRVGGGVVRLGPARFPKQTQRRMASYVRNQAHMLRLRHVPLRWKLRTLAYLPLQVASYAVSEKENGASAGRLTRAAIDGLRARFEPPGGQG